MTADPVFSERAFKRERKINDWRTLCVETDQNLEWISSTNFVVMARTLEEEVAR